MQVRLLFFISHFRVEHRFLGDGDAAIGDGAVEAGIVARVASAAGLFHLQ